MTLMTLPTWGETVGCGHIVSFSMPHDKPGDEGPKDRPCLVLSVIRQEDGPDLVLLVYGTGEHKKFLSRRGLTLLVDRERDIAESRLKKPTRFIPRRRIVVPIDDPRFRCKGGTPVIGRLPRSFRDRLTQMRRYIVQDLRRKSSDQLSMV